MEEQKRVKLSKSILDMKFMKKTKERVKKEAEDAEGQAMYSSEITDEMRRSGNIVFVETSIFHCKNLVEGRLSFGGMNTDIEKIMEGKHAKALEDAERLKEKDVTDQDMAQYSTLVDTMGKRFQNKRNRNNRRKFMKPADY